MMWCSSAQWFQRSKTLVPPILSLFKVINTNGIGVLSATELWQSMSGALLVSHSHMEKRETLPPL